MARSCIFCGDDSKPLTNEHIYGAWISRFFTKHYGEILTGKVELVDSDGTVKDFNITPFSAFRKDCLR